MIDLAEVLSPGISRSSDARKIPSERVELAKSWRVLREIVAKVDGAREIVAKGCHGNTNAPDPRSE